MSDDAIAIVVVAVFLLGALGVGVLGAEIYDRRRARRRRSDVRGRLDIGEAMNRKQ